MHFGALSVIDAAGPISQQELGDYVKKDRTTIVALVDDLEEEGLVERRRNPADRRAYALELTEKGHDWLPRRGPPCSRAEDRLLADLDDAERATSCAMLQRVLFTPAPAASRLEKPAGRSGGRPRPSRTAGRRRSATAPGPGGRPSRTRPARPADRPSARRERCRR